MGGRHGLGDLEGKLLEVSGWLLVSHQKLVFYPQSMSPHRDWYFIPNLYVLVSYSHSLCGDKRFSCVTTYTRVDRLFSRQQARFAVQTREHWSGRETGLAKSVSPNRLTQRWGGVSSEGRRGRWGTPAMELRICSAMVHDPHQLLLPSYV